jgi:hypothetical protein
MEPAVRVFTYGPLCTDLGGSSLSGFLKLNLTCAVPLVQLLEELDIDPDLVQLVMVNHRSVPKNAIIRPGDRIALFPREYPIFADCVNPRMSGGAPGRSEWRINLLRMQYHEGSACQEE